MINFIDKQYVLDNVENISANQDKEIDRLVVLASRRVDFITDNETQDWWTTAKPDEQEQVRQATLLICERWLKIGIPWTRISGSISAGGGSFSESNPQNPAYVPHIALEILTNLGLYNPNILEAEDNYGGCSKCGSNLPYDESGLMEMIEKWFGGRLDAKENVVRIEPPKNTDGKTYVIAWKNGTRQVVEAGIFGSGSSSLNPYVDTIGATTQAKIYDLLVNDKPAFIDTNSTGYGIKFFNVVKKDISSGKATATGLIEFNNKTTIIKVTADKDDPSPVIFTATDLPTGGTPVDQIKFYSTLASFQTTSPGTIGWTNDPQASNGENDQAAFLINDAGNIKTISSYNPPSTGGGEPVTDTPLDLTDPSTDVSTLDQAKIYRDANGLIFGYTTLGKWQEVITRDTLDKALVGTGKDLYKDATGIKFVKLANGEVSATFPKLTGDIDTGFKILVTGTSTVGSTFTAVPVTDTKGDTKYWVGTDHKYNKNPALQFVKTDNNDGTFTYVLYAWAKDTPGTIMAGGDADGLIAEQHFFTHLVEVGTGSGSGGGNTTPTPGGTDIKKYTEAEWTAAKLGFTPSGNTILFGLATLSASYSPEIDVDGDWYISWDGTKEVIAPNFETLQAIIAKKANKYTDAEWTAAKGTYDKTSVGVLFGYLLSTTDPTLVTYDGTQENKYLTASALSRLEQRITNLENNQPAGAIANQYRIKLDADKLLEVGEISPTNPDGDEVKMQGYLSLGSDLDIPFNASFGKIGNQTTYLINYSDNENLPLDVYVKDGKIYFHNKSTEILNVKIDYIDTVNSASLPSFVNPVFKDLDSTYAVQTPNGTTKTINFAVGPNNLTTDNGLTEIEIRGELLKKASDQDYQATKQSVIANTQAAAANTTKAAANEQSIQVISTNANVDSGRITALETYKSTSEIKDNSQDIAISTANQAISNLNQEVSRVQALGAYVGEYAGTISGTTPAQITTEILAIKRVADPTYQPKNGDYLFIGPDDNSLIQYVYDTGRSIFFKSSGNNKIDLTGYVTTGQIIPKTELERQLNAKVEVGDVVSPGQLTTALKPYALEGQTVPLTEYNQDQAKVAKEASVQARFNVRRTNAENDDRYLQIEESHGEKDVDLTGTTPTTITVDKLIGDNKQRIGRIQANQLFSTIPKELTATTYMNYVFYKRLNNWKIIVWDEGIRYLNEWEATTGVTSTPLHNLNWTKKTLMPKELTNAQFISQYKNLNKPVNAYVTNYTDKRGQIWNRVFMRYDGATEFYTLDWELLRLQIALGGGGTGPGTPPPGGGTGAIILDTGTVGTYSDQIKTAIGDGQVVWLLRDTSGLFERVLIKDYGKPGSGSFETEFFGTNRGGIEAIQYSQQLSPTIKIVILPIATPHPAQSGGGIEWLTANYTDLNDFKSNGKNYEAVFWNQNPDGTANSEGFTMLVKVSGVIKQFNTLEELKKVFLTEEYIKNNIEFRIDTLEKANGAITPQIVGDGVSVKLPYDVKRFKKINDNDIATFSTIKTNPDGTKTHYTSRPFVIGSPARDLEFVNDNDPTDKVVITNFQSTTDSSGQPTIKGDNTADLGKFVGTNVTHKEPSPNNVKPINIVDGTPTELAVPPAEVGNITPDAKVVLSTTKINPNGSISHYHSEPQKIDGVKRDVVFTDQNGNQITITDFIPKVTNIGGLEINGNGWSDIGSIDKIHIQPIPKRTPVELLQQNDAESLAFQISLGKTPIIPVGDVSKQLYGTPQLQSNYNILSKNNFDVKYLVHIGDHQITTLKTPEIYAGFRGTNINSDYITFSQPGKNSTMKSFYAVNEPNSNKTTIVFENKTGPSSSSRVLTSVDVNKDPVANQNLISKQIKLSYDKWIFLNGPTIAGDWNTTDKITAVYPVKIAGVNAPANFWSVKYDIEYTTTTAVDKTYKLDPSTEKWVNIANSLDILDKLPTHLDANHSIEVERIA